MPADNSYGIDLGTDTVKIYDKHRKKIIKEANRIAVRSDGEIIAAGDAAKEIEGKNPEDIQVISPVESGRIHDVFMAEAVLHTFLKKLGGGSVFGPTLFFSVPADMTDIERRAYYTVGRRGRFRHSHIFMAEKPVCDAVAMGIPIMTTSGAMTVDIGLRSTEVSVIAGRKVIISSILPVGGFDIDAEIAGSVRRRNGFAVSMQTAESLKISLAGLSGDTGSGKKVGGVDIESGLPLYERVSSASICLCTARTAGRLCEGLKQILERMPPQTGSRIAADGIYVTGATSRIPGLAGFIEKNTGVPVNIPDSYEYSTINGLAEIMSGKEFARWVFEPGKKN